VLSGEDGVEYARESSAWPAQAMSVCLHTVVIAILALLVPPPLDGGEDRENAVWIAHVLASTGEESTSGPSGNLKDEQRGDSTPPGTAEIPSLVAEARVLSRPVTATQRNAPAAVRLGDSGIDTRLEEAVREARAFGMIGLLSEPRLSMDDAEHRWDLATAESADDPTGVGEAWSNGDEGWNGFENLPGAGEEGGGGSGEGINIGEIGTIGHGSGHCDTCTGMRVSGGRGAGHLAGGHQTRAPVLRCGPPPSAKDVGVSGCGATVVGRLPPESIQRIVRASFGRFRGCYESALVTNPSLQGRIVAKFVIDRTGAVTMASDAGSSFPDREVIACVLRGFQSLSFPEPEGGIVAVVYPLDLRSEASGV
jgi:hypothetical protein